MIPTENCTVKEVVSKKKYFKILLISAQIILNKFWY